MTNAPDFQKTDARNAGVSKKHRSSSVTTEIAQDQQTIINQDPDDSDQNSSSRKLLTYYDFLEYAEQLPDTSDKTPGDLVNEMEEHENIGNILSLVNYVQTLCGAVSESKSSKPEQFAEGVIGDEQLRALHETVPILFFDSYIQTAKPMPQLTTILKNMGVEPYEWEAKYKGCREYECDHGHTVLIPEIGKKTTSTSYNPYIRYKTSKSNGSKSYRKLRNSLGTNYVSSLVLTFPQEVDDQFVSDPESVSNKCWKVYKLFFHRLQDKKTSDNLNLGSSTSLHPQSTRNPFKPHLHFHSIIPLKVAPYTTYKKRKYIEKKYKRFFKDRRELQHHLIDLEKRYQSDDYDLDYSNYFQQRAPLEDLKKGISHVLNDKLKENLPVSSLHWTLKTVDSSDWWITSEYGLPTDKTIRVPFDSTVIKRLWTECYKTVFGVTESVEDGQLLDVQLKYSNNRKKILHWLAYKARPPIVDLDKYYRYKVDGESLDNNSTNNMDFIKYLLDHSTDTRTFGYWNALTNLERVDPKDLDAVCPLCGGELSKTEDRYWDIPNKTLLYLEQGNKYIIAPKKAPPDSDVNFSGGTSNRSQPVLAMLESGPQPKSELLEKFGRPHIKHLLRNGEIFEPRPNVIKKL